MPAPVVAGILATASAEDVLRHGFETARDRDVPLHILVAGPAAAAVGELRDLIERWTEKYPAVPSTVSVRTGVDAAIVLVAAAHGGDLLVVAEPCDARETAIVRAVTRRPHCPLAIVPTHPAE
jgi:hypothetical protein